MDFFAVIAAILSLFLLIGIGFFARRHGFLGASRVHQISHIVVNIAIPALTLSSMQVPNTGPAMGMVEATLAIAFAYYIGAFLFSLLICHFLPATPREKGVFQFMLVFPNVGFMGIPVSEVILGPDSLFYVILFNLPFNLLVFTMGIWLLAHERPDRPDWRLLLTPGLIASVAGLALFFIGYDIPFPVDVTLDWIGKATTPLAMIVVGALLAALPVSRLAGDWRIVTITALRLLVLPVLAFILLAPILDDRLLLFSTVLLIAMPVAANTVLLSEEYDVDATLASQGVFLSTLVSCATIPLIWLFLL
jgi:malate permease and related proteins